MAGLVIVSVVVVLVASGSDETDSGASTAVDWIKILIGVLFLLMAFGQCASGRGGARPPMPKWMAAIDRFTAGKSLGLGALLSGLNPESLALTLAAAASIAQAGLGGGETAIAIAVFVIIGSITVAGPVVFYMCASAKAAGPLDSIKQFMAEHNAVIMMVVLLVRAPRCSARESAV